MNKVNVFLLAERNRRARKSNTVNKRRDLVNEIFEILGRNNFYYEIYIKSAGDLINSEETIAQSICYSLIKSKQSSFDQKDKMHGFLFESIQRDFTQKRRGLNEKEEFFWFYFNFLKNNYQKEYEFRRIQNLKEHLLSNRKVIEFFMRKVLDKKFNLIYVRRLIENFNVDPIIKKKLIMFLNNEKTMNFEKLIEYLSFSEISFKKSLSLNNL